jgi:hypothetical protein
VIAADIVSNPTNYYINVHTTDFPGGAIRGQLSAAQPIGQAHLLAEPLRAYDSRTADGPIAINTTRLVGLSTGVDGAQGAHLAVPARATSAIVTLTVQLSCRGHWRRWISKLFSGVVDPTIDKHDQLVRRIRTSPYAQVAVGATGHQRVRRSQPDRFIIDVPQPSEVAFDLLIAPLLAWV